MKKIILVLLISLVLASIPLAQAHKKDPITVNAVIVSGIGSTAVTFCGPFQIDGGQIFCGSGTAPTTFTPSVSLSLTSQPTSYVTLLVSAECVTVTTSPAATITPVLLPTSCTPGTLATFIYTITALSTATYTVTVIAS